MKREINRDVFEDIVEIVNALYRFVDPVYEKECQLMIVDHLQKIRNGENRVQAYLNKMKATKEEREWLYEWLMEGNQFEYNESNYCDEKGSPLDFISALRADENRREEYMKDEHLQSIEE